MPVAETWFGIQLYFAITLTLKNKECCLCFFVECLKQRRDFIFSKRYTCYVFILMQIFHTLTTCMSHVLIGSAAAAAVKTMKPFNFQRTVETEGFYLKMYMFKMKHWHVNKQHRICDMHATAIFVANRAAKSLRIYIGIRKIQWIRS